MAIPRPKGARTAWNAAAYDSLHGFVARGGEAMIDMLDPRPGERILDLGCGTGHLTQQIADRGATVVGIDISPDMIERAHANYPTLDFRLGDATSLRFNEPFDGVFSNAVLHWVPEASQPAVAESVARALKPGGRFVVELGGLGNTQRVVGALEATLATMGVNSGANPWYFPSIGEYATTLEAHGLSVVHAELFDRPTPLEDSARGIRHWLEMFAVAFLAAAPPGRVDELISEVERRLRPELFRDDRWLVDYRRLRLVAIRDA